MQFSIVLTILASILCVAAAGNDNGKKNNGNNNGGGRGNGNNNNGNLQLNPNLLCTACEGDGIVAGSAAKGQSPSATSNDNFINFCGEDGQKNLPITNGKQIKTGSCNPIPMGVIAATTRMPASKFQFPKNFDTVKANQNFTVKMAIQNLATGDFTNPDSTYFSAPCSADGSGTIKGHSHITIQKISSLQDTNIADPTQFAFFVGLNAQAQNGILSATVTGGLPAGDYRLASINTCANHQAVLVAVAQRGSNDDMIYFTVTEDGQGNGGNNNGVGNNGGNNGGNGGNGNNNNGGNNGNGNGNNGGNKNNGNGNNGNNGGNGRGNGRGQGKGNNKRANNNGEESDPCEEEEQDSTNKNGRRGMRNNRLAKRRFNVGREMYV